MNQLHTPEVPQQQEEAQGVLQPPPPPQKLAKNNLPMPPEVRHTNLEDSLNEDPIVQTASKASTSKTIQPPPPEGAPVQNNAPPAYPDNLVLPSASTPSSGVETVKNDSSDGSFHSLSTSQVQTDSTTPHCPIEASSTNSSAPSTAKLFLQDFNQTAKNLALDITKVVVSDSPRQRKEVSLWSSLFSSK